MISDLLNAASGVTETTLLPEDVFEVKLRNGTGTDVTTNTNIDMTKGYMLWTKRRNGVSDFVSYSSGLGVTNELVLNSTAAMTTQPAGLKAVSATGYTIGSSSKMNAGGSTYVDFLFRVAPQFFTITSYYSNQTSTSAVPHSLGVVPEFILVKAINTKEGSNPDYYSSWYVFARKSGGEYIRSNGNGGSGLNLDGAVPYTLDSSAVTSSAIYPYYFGNGGYEYNVSYVAYLFASYKGVSKVSSYIGNGTSQTIACDFSAGARFVVIKRIDGVGDWYVWDTVRGIVAANDPHLSLNKASAEASNSDDSIDPESSGFIVNQNTATNINVNAGTYIYLAIA